MGIKYVQLKNIRALRTLLQNRLSQEDLVHKLCMLSCLGAATFYHKMTFKLVPKAIHFKPRLLLKIGSVLKTRN